MNETCPYCGGDESKCDFDYKTDRCSEMQRLFADQQAALAEESSKPPQ